MQKQKEAKSLFWVLRTELFLTARFCDLQNLDLDCHTNPANMLAMTEYYKFAFISQSIRATNHNRSNGGVAFVFMKKFGLSTRL